MSNHKNLVFFNKEGDALNFGYNDTTDRFEGDILFHENSADTYKTYGIYTMERIPSFEFESVGNLTLQRFQLFNEWGFHFYGGTTQSKPIIGIEPVNNDPGFYSKWIYGEDFDIHFPVGSIITFNQEVFEFTNKDKTYNVVTVKNNAIMVISEMDNSSFENEYYSLYTDDTTFSTTDSNGLTQYYYTISIVNGIGIYNYIDSKYQNNLSKWNEANFYEKYFVGQKLNVVNTNLNDGRYTILNTDLTDPVSFEYYASALPAGKDLIIEFLSKTDLPRIYEGSLLITEDGRIKLDEVVPDIIKPGTSFRLFGSNQNTGDLTVADVPKFEALAKETYFATASQVLYNNLLFDCVKGYTHSFSKASNTGLVTPLSQDYWKRSSTIKVSNKVYKDNVLNGQIYLTTDKLYFQQAFTKSSAMTLAMAAENFASEMKTLNIDLYSKNGVIKADLMWPSKYAVVNFFAGTLNNKIGDVIQTNERLVEVKEMIRPELNYDLCENFRYNIVFTDIDSFGIKIVIDKEIYDVEAELIYTGPFVDIERSIDRTLRNWLERNYISLNLLGIVAELQYIGSLSSVFFNSIVLKTEYPNVPMNIDRVEVGTTADFYIEHSRVLFTGTHSIGSSLTFNINGTEYTQDTIYATYSATASVKQPDVAATLEAWIDAHGEFLTDLGLIPTQINNLVKFDTKKTTPRFTYTVNNGKIQLPGSNEIIITNKLKGSFGSLITSNSAVLPGGTGASHSFIDAGFATGMVVSVNNTLHPFMNTEFNVNYVDDKNLLLSYQGPFWGLTDSLCNTSPYVTVAFNSGFGQTACLPIQSLGIGNPFNKLAFTAPSFTKYRFSTYYENQSTSLASVPGSSNMIDIKYVQLSESIYVLADNLIVMNASKFEYESYVVLPGNSSSIKLEFNEYNNYLYCLSQNKIFVVDPLLNILMSTIVLSNNASDIAINPINGDVYVSYSNSPTVSVFDWNNELVSTITTPFVDTQTGKMVFNAYREEMFVTTDGDYVVAIDGGQRSITDLYYVNGLDVEEIFYEPVNEAVYAWSNTELWKITGGTATSIPSVTAGTTNKIIFNNLSSELNVSTTNSFMSLQLDSDSKTYDLPIGYYGFMAINQNDGMVYLTTQGSSKSILTINPGNGWVIHTEVTNNNATKIIYNPERKSVWTIVPGSKAVIEIASLVDTSIVPTTVDSIKIDDKKYGTLSEDYLAKQNIWLKSREYLRKPRENYEGEKQVQYYWEWFDDQRPEFFLYDFTGEQLEKGTSYSYTGPMPLGDVPLNKSANRDLTKTSSPEYQQTVFEQVFHDLDFIDSTTNIDASPSALETFIGFRSENEGVLTNILQLYKREDVTLSFTSTVSNNLVITFTTTTDKAGVKTPSIKLNTNSTETFTEKGLKPGQLIKFVITDTSNKTNQFTSFNNGSAFRIREVYTKMITFDTLEDTDIIFDESSVIVDYPTAGKTTYLKTDIEVLDRELARFTTYAQTEVEDIRYKINLANQGKLIGPNEVFIFKEYDVLEGGIDWKFLNSKRKELLLNKHNIFTYVGAYKSVINAINFFGYNDLKLNEYYKNVIPKSKDYGKLFKVEIPDIFDNTVSGWTDNDFIKHTFPNQNYETTNLFNLTYDITDIEGNNVLNYNIDEVTIKLQGLKTWLGDNIIPLTHKILDITGKSNFAAQNQIDHQMYDVKIFNTNEDSTPINFNLNEAYLLPVNSGSTVYNCVIDFFTIIDGIGEEPPKVRTGFVDKPKTKASVYEGKKPTLPDYYTIKIRTFRTYKEWMPFETYKKGDRVVYYGKLFESVIASNKMSNPRKYEEAQDWIEGNQYSVTEIVKYQNRIYTYSGLGVEDTTTPPLFNNGDGADWLEVTNWMEIDYTPVQTIKEYRNTNPAMPNGMTQSAPWPLLPFNFTVDSNLDPFVIIEVSSDNGYGGLFTERKSYEIRGIKDLVQKQIPIERIGPFKPIELI